MTFIARPKRSSTEKALFVVLAIVAGLFLVGLLLVAGPIQALLISSIILAYVFGLILSLLIISLSMVGVHELGHLIAGKLVHFKFYSMRIGPLSWWDSPNGVTVSFRRSDTKAYGYVAMAPTDDRGLRRRYRWFILGGPIASIFLLLVLWFCLPWQHALFGDHAKASLAEIPILGLTWVTVLYALLFVVSSCVPFRYRGIYNDAARLLLPWINNREADLQILSLKWLAEMSTGPRCSEWNTNDLQKLLELSSAPFERATYAQYLGNAFLYSGKLTEGLAALEQSYAFLIKSTGLLADFECAIALDTSFARAYFGKDAQKAREALTKAEAIGSSRLYGFFRARSAIALLEGDFEAARYNAGEGKAWLEQHSDREKPNIKAACEEMDAIVAGCEVGQAGLQETANLGPSSISQI